MRLRHFETLRPICPVCVTTAGAEFPLAIADVSLEADGHILEAVLHCTNASCLREYPVIDGIPLIIANLRQYVADNALRLLLRQDLGAPIEGIVGDCCGPGSEFDQIRQQVSAYVWEHFGDLDPEESVVDPRPGTMFSALSQGVALADPVPDGPVLEVGCSVGGGCFSLAGRTSDLVLGVDLHYPMLRLAAEVLRTGKVRYSRRRVGVVYDRREFDAPFARKENVDFWACDATALPFAAGTFSLAVALNILDSIYAPRELLTSVGRVLAEEGKAVLTCPYDWSPTATPLEGWLGGHSQRSELRGSSEAVVRSMLTPEDGTAGTGGLRLSAERDGLPWHVRLHDRSTMVYRMHLMVATRPGE